MITTTVLRAVVASLTLGLVLGVGAVAAADPTAAPDTLGASVAGYVIADESPAAFVLNLGSVTTTFTATAPDGWEVEPSALMLEPGERGDFILVGTGDAGLMVVHGTASSSAAAGTDATGIEFGSIRVMQTRPFDPMRYASTAAIVALIIASLALIIRRIKPWRFRLVRTA